MRCLVLRISQSIANTGLMFLLSVTLLCAQPAEIPFEHLDTKIELTLVTDVFRDSEDYLWIGSEGQGLLKYDGRNSTLYKRDPIENQHISNHIEKVFEDSRGNIWICSFGGLDLLDKKNDTYRRYINLNRDASKRGTSYVFDMIEDEDQKLWIATGRGLYVYDYSLDTVINYVFSEENYMANVFNSITVDDQGNIWLTGWAHGIYNFNRQSGKFQFMPFDFPNKGLRNRKYICVDSDGEIWVGVTEFGIVRKSLSPSKTTYYKKKADGSGVNSDIFLDIKELEPGKILIGTNQGGLNVFNKKT